MTRFLGQRLPNLQVAIQWISCIAWIVISPVAFSADPPATESWPQEPELSTLDREHWAFQPLSNAAPPHIAAPADVDSPIDAFIQQQLSAKQLPTVAPADRSTWLRRVTFDLTGLPPDPDELQRFLDDLRPDAQHRAIDRLLASPEYGERFAQHWLDLVRFAETDGFEHDKVRPAAWRYRDWLIDALNHDLPYDEFIAQQLAGDELAQADPAVQIATGYLLAGPDMPDINSQDERRHTLLNSITANVGELFLAMQFGCAQCHDHKTDPISQHDFYRLRAFFEPLDLFRGAPATDDQNAGETAPTDQLRVVFTTANKRAEGRLWVRGDFRRPGPELKAAFPRPLASVSGSTEPSGPIATRMAFAQWLTHDAQPLTPRVIVNRLWQQHFGTGIVASSSDFGFMGQSPTHPQLLDWLASDLKRHAWSLKAIHRSIVSSAAYGRSSHAEPSNREHWNQLIAADPQNRWLGRMRPQRLDGEALRDAMLAISGSLSHKAGGPGIMPPLPKEVVSTLLKNQWQANTNPAESMRRSVYLFMRRNLRYPLFEAFDKPDSNLSCSRRNQTTIAPQALHLLNSELVADFADRLAQRLARDYASDNQRIEALYRLCLSRSPTPEEQSAALSFISQQTDTAWSDLCLAIMNTNEFIYVD